MKKMLLATALALLIAGCAQQTFTVQNKPAAVAPKETITHHFFVSGIRQENCRCSQNLWRRRKMLLNRNPANIHKWIARFYYFRRFILHWKRVCIAHDNFMSCPSIWATLVHCSLIYSWVPSSCFCIVMSLSLKVK